MKFKIAVLFSIIIVLVVIVQKTAGNKDIYPVEQDLKTEQYQKSPSVVVADEGRTLYQKYCMACHQTDGSGVPGMFPPLKKSDWMKGDKKKMIQAILKGLSGEIVVNGETYDQAMPKADYLSNSQIAHILTYIRRNFDLLNDSVTVQMVKAERDKIH